MPDQTKKVVCPECDKEATVILEEGEWTGKCDNCGLDVGYIVEKRRRDKAIKKMDDLEAAGAPRPKRGRFNF